MNLSVCLSVCLSFDQIIKTEPIAICMFAMMTCVIFFQGLTLRAVLFFLLFGTGKKFTCTGLKHTNKSHFSF